MQILRALLIRVKRFFTILPPSRHTVFPRTNIDRILAVVFFVVSLAFTVGFGIIGISGTLRFVNTAKPPSDLFFYISADKEMQLHEGWNLIGGPLFSNVSVMEFTEAIGPNLRSVFIYAIGTWYSYDPKRPRFLNTIHNIPAGSGIWVNLKADTVVHLTEVISK